MGFWNNIWQNDAPIVVFLAKRKQSYAAVGKRPKKVSVLAGPGHNFKHNKIGSRRASIYLQIFAFSATHWLNMVSLVLDVIPVSGLVVVVALVGMSEKGKMFGFHWFMFVLANFWHSLVIVVAAHLGFWGVPGISNTPRNPRIISPLDSPQNGTQPGSLLEVFPTLRTSPYFFPIPFIAIERALAGRERGKCLVLISNKLASRSTLGFPPAVSEPL